MKPTICVLFALAFPLAALLADPPTEAEAVRGSWELESMKVEGKAFLAKDAKEFGIPLSMVIDANSIIPSAPAGSEQKFAYKVDPSKDPKQITMDLKQKLANKDSTGKEVQRVVPQKMLGIYQLDGDDHLTICWAKNGAPRFDTKGRVIDNGTAKKRPESLDGGPGTIVFVFKRTAK
jgi:uncharacterized protein (TIGR03067 family)